MEFEPYVSLSHCWGKAPPCRTTQATLASHLAGIAIKQLPQTFQDAIFVCKELGFRYLWIDSLCIVQDDQLDWEVESARMADVYHGAELVLATSSAKDMVSGFLKKREKLVNGQVSAQISPEGRTSVLAYRTMVHKSGIWPGEDPLNGRAWAFQEKYLARRFLSFSSKELSWECQTASDCECGEQMRETQAGPGCLYTSKLIHPNLMRLERPDIYDYWNSFIVHQYTTRDLTRDSDKLIALSGVAALFQKNLPDRYIAGLWESDIVRGIAWHATSRDRQPAINLVLPSWSWASVGSSVFIGGMTPTAKIVALDALYSSASQFGDISNGRLTIQGELALLNIFFDKRVVLQRARGPYLQRQRRRLLARRPASRVCL
jgi:hypothetical protein